MFQIIIGGISQDCADLVLSFVQSALPSGSKFRVVVANGADVCQRLKTVGVSAVCVLVVLSEDLVAQAGTSTEGVRGKLIVFTDKAELERRLSKRYEEATTVGILKTDVISESSLEVVPSLDDVESYTSVVIEAVKDIDNASLCDMFSSVPYAPEGVETLKSVIAGNEDLISELKNNLADSRNKYDTELSEIESSYRDKLSLRDSEHADKLQELSTLNAALTSELGEAKLSLVDLGKLSLRDSEYANKLKELSILNDVLATELSEAKLSLVDLGKSKLHDDESLAELKSCRLSIVNLEVSVGKLNLDLESKSGELLQSESSVVNLNLEIDSLSGELSALHNSLDATGVLLKDAEGTEVALTEALEANEALKLELQSKSGLVQPDSSVELALDSAKLDLDKAYSELKQVKSDLTSRDMQVTNLTSELDLVKSNFFHKVAVKSIVKAKAAVVDVLPISMGGDNTYVFATGGGDSLMLTANYIRNLVDSEPLKNFLVLDIGNETFLDLALATQAASTNPLTWLQGIDSLDSVSGRGRVKNVKLSTLGLTSINDAYFLNVDWDARFKELSEYPATVILNIGNIGNMVRNHLLYSFSKVVKSFVVTRGTPYNLRATCMNLALFSKMENTTVVCLDCTSESAMILGRLNKNGYFCRSIGENETVPL